MLLVKSMIQKKKMRMRKKKKLGKKILFHQELEHRLYKDIHN